ncbi:MAG: hypothetical protein RLZZ292_3625 [Bacteroidota bacterium]|jgi:outer membrane protein TolC
MNVNRSIIKQNFAFLMAFAMSITMLSAQTPAKTFSLQEAINYGVANQIDIQKSDLEIAKNKEKIREGFAGVLPQVKGSAGLNDNLELATSILPGIMFGQPGQDIPVKFGTQYTLAGNIDVSQVLYDKSLLTAVKMTKEAQKTGILNQEKLMEQAVYDITNAYYSAQLMYIQKGIITANIQKLDSLMLITKSQVDNGFVKKMEYNKLVVNQTNLKMDVQTIEQNYKQQLNMLKYFMAYPINAPIILTTDITKPEPSKTVAVRTDSLHSTDLKLVALQKNLTALNIEQLKAAYLPTLSLSFRYGYQAQQNEINFLSEKTKWFPNAVLGLTMNAPIFDGFSKDSKIKQLEIQVKQADLDAKSIQETMLMQVSNALIKMEINQTAIAVQANNIKMAEEIYIITQYQFKAGIGTMTDLLTAETALKEAQSNYLKAIAQVKLAELEILKATGNLHLK